MDLVICTVIDFSINGLCKENRLRSLRTKTPYKIKVKNCKLINLVIGINLTRAITMPRFSNFMRNSIIHFCLFLYMVTCFPRVTVSLLSRLRAVCIVDACYNLSLSNL